MIDENDPYLRILRQIRVHALISGYRNGYKRQTKRYREIMAEYPNGWPDVPRDISNAYNEGFKVSRNCMAELHEHYPEEWLALVREFQESGLAWPEYRYLDMSTIPDVPLSLAHMRPGEVWTPKF